MAEAMEVENGMALEVEDDYIKNEQLEYAFEDLSTPEKLVALIKSNNIAEILDDDALAKIGQKVVDEAEIDDNSRNEWMRRHDKALELANQVAKEKSYPWPKAANVKYPVITTAAIQFNARAYPSIVKGNDVVKVATTGLDPDHMKAARAERVSTHMSWQCLHEMEEWESDQDKQLIILPIVGTDFKKSYFDPSKGRNVSCRVSAKDCIVNNKAKSIETAPRVTECFTLYPQEVTEKRRMGIYLDIEYMTPDGDDDYEPIEFYEQHRMLDLDEDGYPEPYIVTVHKETSKVARIVARFTPENVLLVDESRTQYHTLLDHIQIMPGSDMQVAKIEAEHYYTKFGFLPDPDGGFYDIGLGTLLNPINESINTTLNQLLDAGHLQNAGGGFIGRGMRMKRGETRFRPGEYKHVDVPGDNIRNNIVPLNTPGPSPVLFQLLGMLLNAARELSSTSEVMSGDAQMAMAQPTTVMALIEQGQMVFSAVYKRIHRALGKEFKKLYKLNARYLENETYFMVMDDQKAVARDDYALGDMDVQPVSDPNLATEQQKLARAQFLSQYLQDPFINPIEIRKRIFEAARIEDIETLLMPPQEQQGPDVNMMITLAKLENDKAKIDNEIKKTNAGIIESISSALLNLEKAEAENAGVQMKFYQMMLQNLIQGIASNDRARISGMEGAPSNTMGVGDINAAPAGIDGVMGGEPLAGAEGGALPSPMSGLQGLEQPPME